MAGEAVATIRIDNPAVRVTEWRFAPGAATGYHRHEYPYVVGRWQRAPWWRPVPTAALRPPTS